MCPVFDEHKMKCDLRLCERLLGISLSESQVSSLLGRMGIRYGKGVAIIPPYRVDILHPVDLVEDIAIAYGFENFKPEFSGKATIAVANPMESFKSKLADVLVGLGFLETFTYHLTSVQNQAQKMMMHPNLVLVANAQLSENEALRRSLLPNLLSVLFENKHNEYPQRVFDCGVVFSPDKNSETGVEESQLLGMLSCHERADFTEARQIVEALGSGLGVVWEYREEIHPSFIEGRCASLWLGGKKVGVLGEIHPSVLENFGIITPTVGCELSLTEVFNEIQKMV